MQSRRFSFSNSTTRRAVALLVLFAVCAAAIPIPLGVIYRQPKDSSQPFPCQHCSCGCKNAEQCWINCCCFTPSQKLAWAKANGVTPPWYAAKVTEKTSELAAKSTCEKCESVKHSGCAKCSSTEKSSSACCAAKRTQQPASSEQCEADSQEPEATVVLSIMAFKCKGSANLYTHLPWAIVCSMEQETWSIELLGRHVPPIALPPERVFLIPDVPPPRAIV